MNLSGFLFLFVAAMVFTRPVLVSTDHKVHGSSRTIAILQRRYVNLDGKKHNLKASHREIKVCEKLYGSNLKLPLKVVVLAFLAYNEPDGSKYIDTFVTSALKNGLGPGGDNGELTDAVSSLGNALSQIYLQTHNKKALFYLLTIGLDGGPAEDLGFYRAKVFLKFPYKVAEVWVHASDPQKLSLDVDIDMNVELKKLQLMKLKSSGVLSKMLRMLISSYKKVSIDNLQLPISKISSPCHTGRTRFVIFSSG